MIANGLLLVVTISGVSVKMPKQYTFKTTKSTEWMEEVLDNLPSSERSRFIRFALELALQEREDSLQIDSSLPIMKQRVTPKRTEKVTQGNTEKSDKITQAILDDSDLFSVKIGDKSIDLDNVLDNLYK